MRTFESHTDFWQVTCCQTLHEGLPGCFQYKYRNTLSVAQIPNMIWLVAFLSCIGKFNLPNLPALVSLTYQCKTGKLTCF